MALAPYVTEERIAALGERLDELVAEARALVAEPAGRGDAEDGAGAARRGRRVQRGRAAVKAKRVRKLDPEAPLVENAARIVRTRLDELRSFAPGGAASPSTRPSSTTCGSPPSGCATCSRRPASASARPADAARRRARDLQDVLGELHDCDVMLPRIAAHVAELRDEDAAAVRERAGDAADLDPALLAAAPQPHRLPRAGGARRRRRGAPAAALRALRRALGASIERAATWERLERSIDRALAKARERREVAERAERAAAALEQAERAQREAADRARRAAAELAEAREAQRSRPRPS